MIDNRSMKSTQCGSIRRIVRFILPMVRLNDRWPRQLEFIKDCVDSNRYPHIYWKSLRRSRIYPNRNTLRRYALNHRDTMCLKRDELERNISQRQNFVDELPEDLRSSFLDYVESVVQSRMQKKREVLNRKLSAQTPQASFPDQPERYVHNFSKLQPSTLLFEALSLGPKFCIPQHRDNPIDIEMQFENLFNQTYDLTPHSGEELERFKSTLVNCAYQYRGHRQRRNGPLTKMHLDALNELKRNKDVVVCRPDKGTGIVLSDRREYVSKLISILSDQTKFTQTPSKKDKTEHLEQKSPSALKHSEMMA